MDILSPEDGAATSVRPLTAEFVHNSQNVDSFLSKSSKQQLKSSLDKPPKIPKHMFNTNQIQQSQSASNETIIQLADSFVTEFLSTLRRAPDKYGRLRRRILDSQQTQKMKYIHAPLFVSWLHELGFRINEPLGVVVLLRLGGENIKRHQKPSQRVSDTMRATYNKASHRIQDIQAQSMKEGNLHDNNLFNSSIDNQVPVDGISSSDYFEQSAQESVNLDTQIPYQQQEELDTSVESALARKLEIHTDTEDQISSTHNEEISSRIHISRLLRILQYARFSQSTSSSHDQASSIKSESTNQPHKYKPSQQKSHHRTSMKYNKLSGDEQIFADALTGDRKALQIVSTWPHELIEKLCDTFVVLSQQDKEIYAAMQAGDYINSSTGESHVRQHLLQTKRAIREVPQIQTSGNDEEDSLDQRTDAELVAFSSKGNHEAEKILTHRIRDQLFHDRFHSIIKDLTEQPQMIADIVVRFVRAMCVHHTTAGTNNEGQTRTLTLSQWLESRIEQWKRSKRVVREWRQHRLDKAENAAKEAHYAASYAAIASKLTEMVHRATQQSETAGFSKCLPARQGLELHKRLRDLEKLSQAHAAAVAKAMANQPNEANVTMGISATIPACASTGSETPNGFVTKAEFDKVMQPLLHSLLAVPATAEDAHKLLDAHDWSRQFVQRRLHSKAGRREIYDLVKSNLETTEKLDENGELLFSDDFVFTATEILYRQTIESLLWKRSTSEVVASLAEEENQQALERQSVYQEWVQSKQAKAAEERAQKLHLLKENERQQEIKKRIGKMAYNEWAKAAARGKYVSFRKGNRSLAKRPTGTTNEQLLNRPEWRNVADEVQTELQRTKKEAAIAAQANNNTSVRSRKKTNKASATRIKPSTKQNHIRSAASQDMVTSSPGLSKSAKSKVSLPRRKVRIIRRIRVTHQAAKS